MGANGMGANEKPESERNVLLYPKTREARNRAFSGGKGAVKGAILEGHSRGDDRAMPTQAGVQ